MRSGIRVFMLSKKGQKVAKDLMKLEEDESWKAFFTETVEIKDPFTVRIEHRNALSRSSVTKYQLREIVVKQLNKLDLKEFVDYEVTLL